MLQLLAQDLGELDKLLALEVGVHLDVALRQGVDDGGDALRIVAPQLDAQEAPI